MGAAGSSTATVTITIHVFITQDGGTIDNEACVDPDNAIVENDEGDNCDTKSTPIRKYAPNLSVQKSATPGSVGVGETLTYSVTVSNIGDANAAEGWSIKDTLPSVVSIVGTPVATNGFTCTHDGAATGGVVTCDGPDADADDTGLAVGESTTVTIQVTVTDAASTPFTNTAEIIGAVDVDTSAPPCGGSGVDCVAESELANNTDSVTTSVGGAAIDLVMGDITDTDPRNVGDSLVYTFTVTNGGTQNALAADGNGVVVAVDLPTVGADFQSGIATQGFACVPSGGESVLTCTGDLDAGEATTVTITFAVVASSPPALGIVATVDPNDDILETDETNNAAAEDTTVNVLACTSCIDLVMGQIFATPNPVTDGGQVKYSFTVTNIGDLPTEADPGPNDVRIAIDLDRLSQESSAVSVVATAGFTCTTTPQPVGSPTPEIVCTGNLDPAEGVLVTVTVDANTAVTPSYVDFDVTVDPQGDIAELREFNNAGGKRVDVVAP
jgi:uncharacterized repeat protein (TIGR01451 family)